MALEHSEPSINAAKKVLITSRPLITFVNTIRTIQKTTAKTTVEDPVDELARRLENVFIQRLEGHSYLGPPSQPVQSSNYSQQNYRGGYQRQRPQPNWQRPLATTANARQVSFDDEYFNNGQTDFSSSRHDWGAASSGAYNDDAKNTSEDDGYEAEVKALTTRNRLS